MEWENGAGEAVGCTDEVGFQPAQHLHGRSTRLSSRGLASAQRSAAQKHQCSLEGASSFNP